MGFETANVLAGRNQSIVTALLYKWLCIRWRLCFFVGVGPAPSAMPYVVYMEANTEVDFRKDS